MAKVDLVFRQVDERTREVAFDLALRHIRPDTVHVMDDVRPFSECVLQMLKIEHDCDYVVYLDADCLVLEDMRWFIDQCEAAYVDSYVTDRFRGRIHCGVHITRADLVRRMPTTNGCCRYDADTRPHLHVRFHDTCEIEDVPDELSQRLMARMPAEVIKEIEDALGMEIDGVSIQFLAHVVHFDLRTVALPTAVDGS